jgi:hypothetical protein
MTTHATPAFCLFACLALVAGRADGQDRPGTAGSPKKVLVELYTSQGCDSCPPASDLLGRLAALGYGPDRVVAVGFHVDYFNQPWVDPYSDPEFSRRQLAYNEVQRRNDLYFTPLMMVDGRTPMLGSDRAKALAALDQSLREPAAVGLRPVLEGHGATRTLSVEVVAKSTNLAGRDLVVAVALTEDPVTTRVGSGENGGKTLVEHAVVRRFVKKTFRLDRDAPRSFSFPLELAPGQVAARSSVAVFVQDSANGKVYQAEAVAWEPKATRDDKAAKPKLDERLKGSVQSKNDAERTAPRR